ncbi:MAG: UDP-N-acetylmuramoyl-L-alanine--D-glutamate ligase [Acidimicrobiales bacterium]
MPSSPPLRWPDLRGRRVGVWGVGVEGRATLARLASLGATPAAVVDDNPAVTGVLATAAGGLEALAACDVVVKSPGISRYSDEVVSLESGGVAVVGGLGLWLEEVGTERVIGVTGTKGKSTTTSIAGHLARGLGRSAFVGGNLGAVPWALDAPAGADLFVVEVSSYQATDLWSSPAVMAVTSLHEDHLNWHGTVERYYRDKLGACGRPGAVVTVANGEDERLRVRAGQLQPGPRWVDAEHRDTTWAKALGLRGRHNETNALLAAACLEEMGVEGATDPDRLAAAALGYEPLPHRLETVATVRGVEYVDDSLSTNVLPTIAAAEVFGDRPLALLVGGFDRDIDYRPLAELLARRTAPTWVFTLPQNGDRIRAAVEAAGGEAVPCRDLADAVERAAAVVPANGVVLLSPAAASYGLYPHYLARSAAFCEAVAALT